MEFRFRMTSRALPSQLKHPLALEMELLRISIRTLCDACSSQLKSADVQPTLDFHPEQTSGRPYCLTTHSRILHPLPRPSSPQKKAYSFPVDHASLSFSSYVPVHPLHCTMSVARSIVLLVLCVVTTIGLGHATETPLVYTIGPLVIGGSGCRPDTVSAAPSTYNTSISVLFSSFEAKTKDNAPRVRSACSIALPVNALPGQSIGLFKVDYRGYVYVPNVPNASAALSNEYFFTGQQGIRIKRTYQPGDSMDIFESNSINFQSVIWSPCGGSTTFRVNTAIMAARPAQSPENVQIFIDSLDSSVHGSIQIAVASRKCDLLTGEPL